MSKFCGNCGAKLEDNVLKCKNCGQRVEGEYSTNLLGKILKFAVIGIVILTVVVIGVRIGSNFVGYKGTLNKFEKAYSKYDYETIVNMYSETVLYENDYDYTYLENQVKNKIQQTLSYFDSYVGHSYEIKYEITDCYEMPDYQFEKFKNSHTYFDDNNDDLISKVLVVELDMIAEEKNKSSNRTISLILTKENGKWKIADFN